MNYPNAAVRAAGVLVAVLGAGAAGAQSEPAHAVFVMTNDAKSNEVIAYERTAYGTLQTARRYRTEGRGSGGLVDPLASQGSLSLSTDRAWLFATNAGSGTLSAFRVDGAQLFLTDKISTEGSEPNSVAQFGRLVYVLNAAGSSSVVGFNLDGGHLSRIADSIRYLSGTAVGPGSVAFSPDGRYLVVTEKATPAIDVFKVLSDGTLSPVKVNKAVGPGTFSALFAPNGTLIVAETGVAGATDGSTISSYAIQTDGTLKAISASVPTLGAATCWDVVTDKGRFVYTSNAGTGSLSGFSIGATGTLDPVPGTVVGTNPTGSTNIDMAASPDGSFLYTLNTATGKIGEFAIDSRSGSLTNLGTQGQLPASAGLNGIAAN
jgi:6-phosphogluconolactonase (cycloisomerase 2 family)